MFMAIAHMAIAGTRFKWQYWKFSKWQTFKNDVSNFKF